MNLTDYIAAAPEITLLGLICVVMIADLFIENGYIETGSYRINGGDWVGFDAQTLPGSGAKDSNGEHVIALGAPTDIKWIDFSAPGRINGENHEFSVVGFGLAEDGVLPPRDDVPIDGPIGSTPEPGAALLFAAGLLVISRRRR